MQAQEGGKYHASSRNKIGSMDWIDLASQGLCCKELVG